MYSRRGFLIGLMIYTPLLLTPIAWLNSIQANDNKRSGRKFMKQGWVLQEGDV
jgi:hypothetical protein